ncbi:ubiquitin domain-containing protein ubfd1 [Anaeramoeba flamelloides]|uniref:Ubiquitin domain-containing protein ubfd1 n=1 Tax=Anaeramoeba flamelloides TaxID=1746091 RepID=A0AAV7Z5B2_9EUKA|nr:ubiquitin domain-containing protein ubfd1 [Anaeramoeba flamelloides]|eukprot:Anaeramoba_flamelloidesa589566_43.p1 GENE.a589566_43~~a589566_43.p1  ORF type:complete len:239 (-),score=52.37 a589566_43:177-893(-)
MNILETNNQVTFTLKYKKQSHVLTMELDDTIGDLKSIAEQKTQVPKSLQKLIYKGIQKNDHKTLKQARLRNKSKVLLIGNSLQDIAKTNLTPVEKDVEDQSSWKVDSDKNNEYCNLQIHQQILNKRQPGYGIPEKFKGKHLHLPKSSINDVWDEDGKRVQLTFKVNQDQLHIKSYGQKLIVKLDLIKDFYSQETKNYDGYSYFGLQTGYSERSVLWFYYVPSHYIRAIRNAILGDWKI